MADFNGTRDSNVAISEDNAGRKVLILDTIPTRTQTQLHIQVKVQENGSGNGLV